MECEASIVEGCRKSNNTTTAWFHTGFHSGGRRISGGPIEGPELSRVAFDEILVFLKRRVGILICNAFNFFSKPCQKFKI